jgi:hypothetical protein
MISLLICVCTPALAGAPAKPMDPVLALRYRAGAVRYSLKMLLCRLGLEEQNRRRAESLINKTFKNVRESLRRRRLAQAVQQVSQRDVKLRALVPPAARPRFDTGMKLLHSYWAQRLAAETKRRKPVIAAGTHRAKVQSLLTKYWEQVRSLEAEYIKALDKQVGKPRWWLKAEGGLVGVTAVNDVCSVMRVDAAKGAKCKADITAYWKSLQDRKLTANMARTSYQALRKKIEATLGLKDTARLLAGLRFNDEYVRRRNELDLYHAVESEIARATKTDRKIIDYFKLKDSLFVKRDWPNKELPAVVGPGGSWKPAPAKS